VSIQHRIRGVRVLKAVSSPIRLQILSLLFDQGPLSYTELMSLSKMNPSRDAGRFAYHLKFLLKADLIEADVESKKYGLTDLGKMVIDVAERIEKKTFKPKGMLVRTSRFALEEFDSNKIANSITRETRMPAELAQKVAKEAEKRLIRSKTKYLTAPLVREVVNSILIEKGLEEYRHKLTRLGLPVHDLTALIEAKSRKPQKTSSMHETAGEAVLKEYTLLNVFPRDMADAHLSGALNVGGLSSWILKPEEVIHDVRFFFQNGINMEGINVFHPSFSPPKNLESALSTVLNVLLHSAKEISEAQTIDYFNLFLAPFARGEDSSRVKELLRLFISTVNPYVNVSLGIELTMPDFVTDKSAIGPFGKSHGKYGDFKEETQFLASTLLEIISEESQQKPLFNPNIILKMRSEVFQDEHAKALFLKAHHLASEKGVIYFANLLEKEQSQSVFSASGIRLGAELNEDWEIDTLRTGSIGRVTINLPRIVYEAGRDKAKFFEIFKERLEMAARALEIKQRALRQHGKGLMPFLMQNANGDHYFRPENCSGIINLAGLRESAEAFLEKSIDETEKVLEFAEEIVQNVWASAYRITRKRRKRLYTAVLPDSESSERLAHLDVERYGIAKVRFSGARDKPFYSSAGRLTLHGGKISSELLAFEGKMQKLHSGGGLTVIELGEAEHKADELASLTRQLIENLRIDFFTYNRKLTYCVNCKRSWFGLLHKCPSCGSISTLTVFDRFAST